MLLLEIYCRLIMLSSRATSNLDNQQKICLKLISFNWSIDLWLNFYRSHAHSTSLALTAIVWAFGKGFNWWCVCLLVSQIYFTCGETLAIVRHIYCIYYLRYSRLFWSIEFLSYIATEYHIFSFETWAIMVYYNNWDSLQRYCQGSSFSNILWLIMSMLTNRNPFVPTVVKKEEEGRMYTLLIPKCSTLKAKLLDTALNTTIDIKQHAREKTGTIAKWW